jgi:hypothetical protein
MAPYQRQVSIRMKYFQRHLYRDHLRPEWRSGARHPLRSFVLCGMLIVQTSAGRRSLTFAGELALAGGMKPAYLGR